MKLEWKYFKQTNSHICTKCGSFLWEMREICEKCGGTNTLRKTTKKDYKTYFMKKELD